MEQVKKEYSHDLEKLRKAAGRRGIHMPREVMDEFRRLNTWDNNNRYDTRIKYTRDVRELLAASSAVIRWAERIGGKTGE